MTVKVGDKVRIVGNTASSCNKVGDVGVVTEVGSIDCRIYVKGNDGRGNWSYLSEVELVSDTPDTAQISTQCRDKMEECMGNGRYVKAVKWAQIAELVEALENEE